MVIEGVLIAESLQVGRVFDAVPLAVTAIERVDAPGGSRPGLPTYWTLIDFEAPDDAAIRLADALESALDEGGWYCNFRTGTETFVVFTGLSFRYPRGEVAGRDAAADHARSKGIPESQLDWPI